MTPRDKLDRPIAVGDFIAYGHALGRSAALKIGRVVAIRCLAEPTWRGGSPWRITVAGIDEASWHTTRISRGTLQFPDRAIVVPREDVPAHWRGMLEAV